MGVCNRTGTRYTGIGLVFQDIYSRAQTPLVDLVLRQEYLTADVIALCNLLGLPAPAASQPTARERDP